MSKASDIAAIVESRIANIKVANGYATEIGSRIFRGRASLDESMMPCAVIVEGDDNVEASQPSRAKIAQTYIVEGHVECDPDHPNDAAHGVIADIKRAIFSGDLTFGQNCRKEDVRYIGRNIATRPDGLAYVAASVRFSITYPEDLTNP